MKAAILFAVYAEEACSFVERLLKYQVSVDVHYSQDTIEVWDTYDRVAHKIQVLASSSGSTAAPGTSSLPAESGQYEEFKQRLLNDPEFLEKIGRTLKDKQP